MIRRAKLSLQMKHFCIIPRAPSLKFFCTSLVEMNGAHAGELPCVLCPKSQKCCSKAYVGCARTLKKIVRHAHTPQHVREHVEKFYISVSCAKSAVIWGLFPLLSKGNFDNGLLLFNLCKVFWNTLIVVSLVRKSILKFLAFLILLVISFCMNSA